MKALAITTCNREQWHHHGRKMALSFLRYWPAEIPLRVYTEHFTVENPVIQAEELNTVAPWLVPWKAERTSQQHGYLGERYNFKLDAVKFSHKVAAWEAAARDPELDLLIWLDADCIFHAPVNRLWLHQLFPEPAAVAWLDRETIYPETGVLMFRLPAARKVLETAVGYYTSGAIFNLPGWTDCHVIEAVVNAAVAKGEIPPPASLSGQGRVTAHPAVNGPLGAVLDHCKGKRKQVGRSLSKDVKFPRTESYWKSA